MKVGKITDNKFWQCILRDRLKKTSHTQQNRLIFLLVQRLAAAFEEVDSTPMEGFSPEAVDEILNLKEKGLRSVLLLPIGYRDTENDWLVNLTKVRKSKEDFITELN